jgi:hypothetical protein
MGMGGASSTGGMAIGVVAASRNASMSVPVFRSESGVIAISRVLAPDDGWLVARSVAPAGGVLGFTPVRAGENRDVALRVRSIDDRNVSVTLFVDRGVRGSFDFDPQRPDSSLDKPVLVDGVPVGFAVTLNGWGVEAKPNTALVMVEDQQAGPTMEVAYLLVPAQSWIEVRRIEKGVPTARLGLALRPAGEFQRVVVPLQGALPNDEVLVTVLADRGESGSSEPLTDDPLAAVDQPWISAGVVVSQRVRLR